MKLETGVPVRESEFRLAVNHIYGCNAGMLVEIVPVKITRSNGLQWEGDVRVFELSGHERATRYYAWPEAVNRTTIKIQVILQSNEISSPEQAVQSVLLNSA